MFLLTMQDAAYPARLRDIFDPPVLLYGKGSLPLFAAGWVDYAPRPIANGWLALDLAPLSGGIWQIE